MQFNHDSMSGVRVAEELVNTLGGGGWDGGALADLLAVHLFHNPQVGAPEEAFLRDWTTRPGHLHHGGYCSARCGNAEAVMRYRERGHYAGRP